MKRIKCAALYILDSTRLGARGMWLHVPACGTVWQPPKCVVFLASTNQFCAWLMPNCVAFFAQRGREKQKERGRAHELNLTVGHFSSQLCFSWVRGQWQKLKAKSWKSNRITDAAASPLACVSIVTRQLDWLLFSSDFKLKLFVTFRHVAKFSTKRQSILARRQIKSYDKRSWVAMAPVGHLDI